ncbi:hypothetical protein [Winogradskyella sp. 3972H.M.0a.05]|uniref:DUF5004 domain-containing protein n=1 Tax=Winogradskyella sp. 3972H.M.0a.05 TaxID=2950277 RepID=UPI003392AAC2
MKRIFALVSFLFLFTAITCDDEPLDNGIEANNQNPDVTCEQAILDVADAALAFINLTEDDENYTELCLDYRDALEVQLAACGDSEGAIQAAIDALGDCGDDGNGQTEVDIVGTWQLTAWIGEEPIDLNNDGTENIDFLQEMDCYNNEFLEFNADGTGVSTNNSYADILIEGEIGDNNTVEFSVDCIIEFEESSFTWEEQNGNYVLTVNGDALNATKDGNELSIFIESGFVVVDSEDLTVTITQDLTFVYTKQ